MSFPRYGQYKDSGVECLGEVPEHWEINIFKHQIRMRYGDALSSENREDGDVEVFGSNGQVGSHCMANTRVPAIIVGRKGSYGKVVWAEKGGFVIDTAYAIDCDTTSLNLRWVFYALQPLGLDTLSQDTGVPGLAREKAYEIRIVVPPATEQETIAAFLDRETAKIDALMTEQRRLIELLKEKRQAVISHAVTKGLNPKAKMKDSGIEWLGEVPEHWSITKLKYVTDEIVDCPHETPIYDDDGEYFVIRTADLESGILDLSEMYKVDSVQYVIRIRREPLVQNDIVYGREGERWGFAALVPKSDSYCLGQRMMQFRSSANSCPRFLMWQINSLSTYCQGQVDTVGATSPHVNVGTIRNYRLSEPYITEQQEISRFIDSETTKLDELTAEAQRAISLLQERRTALISAAVTGKIDVRRLVPTFQT